MHHHHLFPCIPTNEPVAETVMSCDASNSPLKAAPQAFDTSVSQVIVNPLCVELLVNAPVEPDCTPSKVEFC